MQLEYDPQGLGVISLFGDVRLADLELVPLDDEIGEELNEEIIYYRSIRNERA